VAPRRLILALLLTLAGSATALAGPDPAAVVGVAREVHVNQDVDGDVVALLSDVYLGPGADVRGHAVAIFGRVHVDPGARVGGRIVALSSLATLTVHPGEGGGRRASAVALRLLAAGGWLLVTTLVALLAPMRLHAGVDLAARLGLRLLLLGAMVAVTVFAAVVAALGLGARVGVPLATAMMLAFLLGKAYGLSVLGGSLGLRLGRRIASRRPPLTVSVFLGVGLLLLTRVLPVVGEVAWTVVSITALGAGVFALALAPHGKTVGASVPPANSA
jgi:hypothetical protein